MKAPLTALALLIALTGCGGSDGSDLDDVDAIRDKLAAADLDCTSYEQNKEVVGAKEDGSCEIDGDTVTITIYQDAGQRATIREAFSAFASGFNVDGEAWTVNVPTKDMAEKVADALGGKVQ